MGQVLTLTETSLKTEEKKYNLKIDEEEAKLWLQTGCQVYIFIALQGSIVEGG